MREIRIYQPGDYQVGDTLLLSEEAGQHVGVVLRLQAGKHLTLFRGDNREFLAEIISVHKKKVSVSLVSQQRVNRESSRGIHLVQALSKGEKMEWIVQKAVELGVTSITPLITEHCAVNMDQERLAKKIKQWQAIAIAACEQSGRNQIPTVHNVLDIAHFFQQTQNKEGFILMPQAGKTWREYPTPSDDIFLLIGPEGGLSKKESQTGLNAGFKPLTVGPRILRTETAAISVLSILQAVWGDL